MAEDCSYWSMRPTNTTRKDKKYYVVEFDDGVAVVSYSWLRSPNQKNQGFTCYWPDGRTSSRIRRMAKEHAPVDQKEWTIHDVRLLASSDDWNRVLEKEIKSQETSCIDTEEEDRSPRMAKRQSRPPSRFDEEDSMSMDEENQMPATHVRCSTGEGSLTTMTTSTTSSARRCSTPNLSLVERSPSVEHLVSPRGSNTGFEKTVLKLLTELSLEGKELRKQVDYNSSLLMELSVAGQNKDTPLDVDIDLPVALPLLTLEDVQTLETSLKDQVLTKKLMEPYTPKDQ
ncbi:PREDICTED: uncharacterized protein LOC106816701 [Priapulus caudatus]|uniref:Uncharacterized protein LOC106816701 n=1 Tax=Priapulus caudatus TaxID=37621 RepID=A0ABM1EX86_PRICU|nr:PREDICTED: uncharacterized protein LOC106816701 [Priapulus caudatus]